MNITLERTRIIFTEYTDLERRRIEDLAATEDKAFIYRDPDDKMICFPPGLLSDVKKTFQKIHIEDKSKTYWDYKTIEPVESNATPRNQLQVDFINFLLDNANKKQNVAGVLSPGTGKTFMSCYSAIKLGYRTLIITPTSGIKVQWAETLTDMFNVKKERVLVVSKPSDFINVKADFVITSQASLASLNKNYDLEAIMKANKFGIKIIDEVQMWFHNIIKIDGNSNICLNWYITGTFGRSGNDENVLYQKMFGNLNIFREKQKKPTIFNRKPGNVYGDKPHMNVYMMWAHSGLSKEEIESVNTSVRYSERSGKWHRYGIAVPAYTNLIIPPDGTMTKFLRTILNTIKKAENQVTYGKTLVLGNTIASAEIVASYLEKMFPNKKIGTIHSKQSKDKNDKVKAECDIVVSTINSCGTGFDLKGLSKLIVFATYSSWILTDQISGRLRRRPDGRETYMWDIVDADVRQLKRWAYNRADVLKRKSKTFKVIDVN